MKKLLLSLTTVAFLAAPTVALAAPVNPDSVAINHQEIACTTKDSVDLTITGTATYDSQHNRLLVVKADGNEIYNTNTKPASWTTLPTTFTVGSHTVTVAVLNHDNQVVASDKWTFEVKQCPDICPNIEGYQGTLPADKYLNDAGDCVTIVVPTTAVATPAATVLPNTGSNWGAIFGIIIIFAAGYLVGWFFNRQ